MRARIVDFLPVGKKSGRLTLDVAGDLRAQVDKLKDHELELKLERYRPGRSLDANAYAWALLHRLAETVNAYPVELYRRYVRDLGCKVVPVCVREEDMQAEVDGFLQGHIGRMVDIGESALPGCVVIHKKFGSSSFNTAQMARFIDAIAEDCRELGIEIRPPDEVEAMLEAWDRR